MVFLRIVVALVLVVFYVRVVVPALSILFNVHRFLLQKKGEKHCKKTMDWLRFFSDFSFL